MSTEAKAELKEIEGNPKYWEGNQELVNRANELSEEIYGTAGVENRTLEKTMAEALDNKAPRDLSEQRAVAGDHSKMPEDFSWGNPPPKEGEGILEMPEKYEIKPEEMPESFEDKADAAETDQELLEVITEVGIEMDEYDLEMLDELSDFGQELGLTEQEAGEIFGNTIRANDHKLHYNQEGGEQRLAELCNNDLDLARNHVERAKAVLKAKGSAKLNSWLESTGAGNSPPVILALSHLYDRGMGGNVDDLGKPILQQFEGK